MARRMSQQAISLTNTARRPPKHAVPPLAMSSENADELSPIEAKKRKIQRACDRCKQRKVRCGGPQTLDQRCYNCVSDKSDCSWNEAAKTHRRNYTKSYVERIEARLKRAEDLLAKLHPGRDFSKELGAPVDPPDQPVAPVIPNAKTSPQNSPSPLTSASSPPPVFDVNAFSTGFWDNEPRDDSSDDDFQIHSLTEQLSQMEVDPAYPRFFGKASGIRLVQEAFAAKHEIRNFRSLVGKAQCAMQRRPEFWKIMPWEARDIDNCNIIAPAVSYRFPNPAHVPRLVDSYFKNSNLYLPLLHRPTFEAQLAEGRHRHDSGFAGVFMMVCAIGARHINDPCFQLEGESHQASAGWQWFTQVQMGRKSLWAIPRLEDIQGLALAVIFLTGSSSPQGCWTMTGIGLRYTQDVGAHRKKVYSSKPTRDEQLWKRAFWVLLTCDRVVSYMLGRPSAVNDEDMDVDEPVDCDDEYWETPNADDAFAQPPERASKLTFFMLMIKLHRILAFTMRTLYSINRSKACFGIVGRDWEHRIVSDLDSELNKWLDSVPDHLRWDPSRENDTFFNQSAMLHCNYYVVQIFVHRRFIPTHGKASTRSFPSQAICTNASRSCVRILDAQQKRNPVPLSDQINPAFTAGVVLLLNIWGSKRTGVNMNTTKEMENVYKCMYILERCEKFWPAAGRCRDLLAELASVHELPLPVSDGPSLKRGREDPNDAGVNGASGGASHPDFSHVSMDPLPQPPLHNPPDYQALSAMPTSNRPLPYSQHMNGDVPAYQPHELQGSAPLYSFRVPEGGFDSTAQPQWNVPHEPAPSSMFDSMDALEMWWSAPSEFQVDDWGSFLDNLKSLEGQALEAAAYP